MTKESLQTKLEDLKQKSEQTIQQITQYEQLITNLREEALMIKGQYQAIEELIKEFTDTPLKSKKG